MLQLHLHTSHAILQYISVNPMNTTAFTTPYIDFTCCIYISCSFLHLVIVFADDRRISIQFSSLLHSVILIADYKRFITFSHPDF